MFKKICQKCRKEYLCKTIASKKCNGCKTPIDSYYQKHKDNRKEYQQKYREKNRKRILQYFKKRRVLLKKIKEERRKKILAVKEGYVKNKYIFTQRKMIHTVI